MEERWRCVRCHRLFHIEEREQEGKNLSYCSDECERRDEEDFYRQK